MGLDRRYFLARVGVLGALAGAGSIAPGLLRGAAAAQPVTDGDPLLDVVRDLLAELSRDTLNGLAVFVVPGPDKYSRAQGTPRTEPGALEAKTPDFLMESLDSFVPAPDQLVTPVAAALANGLADVPLDLPGNLALPLLNLGRLDDVIRLVLRNGQTLPLSLVIALLLNVLATQVNPAAVSGPFLSPFSRLSFEEKAKAFELLEGPDAALAAAIDDELPEPLTGSVSGLMQFVGGALLEFSAFGTYCEWSTFDPKTLGVTDTPVGWQLAGYDVGVVDGWDEFKGYYQGRRKVSAR
jgi:hypothetical protein